MDSEVQNKGKRWFFNDVLESVLIAVVLAFLIRMFVFQPFYIPSSSMEPTLMPNDRIIVNKFIYRFREPARGDVMVFKYPLDPQRDFIKRLIGLPGETIEIKNSLLYINGKEIEESYLPESSFFNDYGPIKVEDGQYFVLGDNRNNSEDSRFWGFLPEENIVGKAILIYWPMSRMDVIK